jgi:hypothetical protein
MSAKPPTPVPTLWHGVQFRSRLEARWAAFFHSLGWRWKYEPQTYATDVGPYTPDFWIPELFGHVEIKPIETIDHRWPHFTKLYGTLYVIEGAPLDLLKTRNPLESYAIKTYDSLHVDRPMVYGAFAACNNCRAVYVSRQGTYCPNGCQRQTLEHSLNIVDIRLMRAFQYARDQFLENA